MPLALIRCPIVRPDAALLAVDQTCLAQEPQVMADRWLVNGKLLGDVADTQRLSLLGEQIKHA